MTFKELVLKAITAYYSGEIIESSVSSKKVVFVWDIQNTSLGKYIRIYIKNDILMNIKNPGYTEREWRKLNNITFAESLSEIMKILEDER